MFNLLLVCLFIQTFLQNSEVKISSLVHLDSWRNLLQVISLYLCIQIRLSENEFIVCFTALTIPYQ